MKLESRLKNVWLFFLRGAGVEYMYMYPEGKGFISVLIKREIVGIVCVSVCEAGARSLVLLFGTMQVQNENHLRQLATSFCMESMTEIIIISIRVI